VSHGPASLPSRTIRHLICEIPVWFLTSIAFCFFSWTRTSADPLTQFGYELRPSLPPFDRVVSCLGLFAHKMFVILSSQ
jgi:hypothetical protein